MDQPGRSTPTVARSRAELTVARRLLTGEVSVVMTMGALHDGHATLIRTARAGADHVIVTIFLNPLQFGPKEDLSHYPRTFDGDLEICAAAGVDLVFAPTPDVVYPDGDPAVLVSAGALGAVLEGQSRPGHFDGVLTVVGKLLHLTGCGRAFFGQKDAQQLVLIRRMVRDLDVPVEVVAVPTVRDADGLALSSRNEYLTEVQRSSALVLSGALATCDVVAGRTLIDAESGVELDYLECVDSDTFEVTPDGDLLIVAARVGTTRLIDCHFLVDVVDAAPPRRA